MEDTHSTPPERTTSPERLVVARVIRPWGLNGQVKIELLTDFPERFRAGKQYYVGETSYLCRKVSRAAGAIVLQLQGVETREAAAELRGAFLEVPVDEALSLPGDTYYHHQVLGLAVWTTEGEHLGQVDEILTTGSNDVYVVRGPRGEILVPATSDVVISVDLEAGRITVEPVPGLLQV